MLAWWDLSRAIRLVAGRAAPLDDAQARGLQMPTTWTDARAAERARWGAGADVASAESFTRFVDALLHRRDAGRGEALKKLADGKPAYVAVHISDVWKLAAARPERVFIAYKDFASDGRFAWPHQIGATMDARSEDRRRLRRRTDGRRDAAALFPAQERRRHADRAAAAVLDLQLPRGSKDLRLSISTRAGGFIVSMSEPCPYEIPHSTCSGKCRNDQLTLVTRRGGIFFSMTRCRVGNSLQCAFG